MRNSRRQIYAVVNDDDETLFQGTVEEVAEHLGVSVTCVYSRANHERTVNGLWVYPTISWKIVYLAQRDDGFTKKTIKGTAADVARHTGLSTSRVRSMARWGKKSYSGWQIKRLTP